MDLPEKATEALWVTDLYHNSDRKLVRKVLAVLGIHTSCVGAPQQRLICPFTQQNTGESCQLRLPCHCQSWLLVRSERLPSAFIKAAWLELQCVKDAKNHSGHPDSQKLTLRAIKTLQPKLAQGWEEEGGVVCSWSGRRHPNSERVNVKEAVETMMVDNEPR